MADDTTTQAADTTTDESQIPLGTPVRDTITGFSGVLTGRCEYLVGATDLRITAQEAGDKGIVQEWLPASRVVEAE